jgi:hypothetical protein
MTGAATMKKITVVKKGQSNSKPSNFCPFMIDYYEPQK